MLSVRSRKSYIYPIPRPDSSVFRGVLPPVLTPKSSAVSPDMSEVVSEAVLGGNGRGSLTGGRADGLVGWSLERGTNPTGNGQDPVFRARRRNLMVI